MARLPIKDGEVNGHGEGPKKDLYKLMGAAWAAVKTSWITRIKLSRGKARQPEYVGKRARSSPHVSLDACQYLVFMMEGVMSRMIDSRFSLHLNLSSAYRRHRA